MFVFCGLDKSTFIISNLLFYKPKFDNKSIYSFFFVTLKLCFIKKHMHILNLIFSLSTLKENGILIFYVVHL